MKFSSIIESITSSLSTVDHAGIKVIDRSFLFELLNANTQDTDIPADEGQSRSFLSFNRDSLLPVTSWILRLIYYALYRIFIGLYYICGWIYTGGKNPHALKHSPRFNFALAVSMIIMFVVVTICTLSFFISDVLFFNNQSYSNRQGAIVMEQPFDRIHHIYLFNTAKYWDNTGIELLEGDEVTITASGAFYSDLQDQVAQSINNDMLNYPLIRISSPTRLITTQNTSTRCLEDSSYNFGTLLYRIKSDINAESAQPKPIIFTNDETTASAFRFTANHSGTLYLCINDILLSKKHIKTLYDDPTTRELLKRHIATDEFRQNQDTLQTYLDIYSKNPYLWFDDNNGEILLNIVVDRSPLLNTSIPLHRRLLNYIFRPIDKHIVNPDGPFYTRFLFWAAMLIVIDLIAGICLRRKQVS